MKALGTVLFTFTALFVASISAGAEIRDGTLELGAREIHAGNTIDLDGQWLYCPGYMLSPAAAPQSVAAKDSVQVPVPQLLSRIQWWLDDSEDFKAYETNRLKKLGFDTDRAEDGWYYLKLNMPELPAGKRLFVEFDGVAMISRTYCNGQLLGEHKGMFSRFEYDLTPHLKKGENLLAVFVSMEKIPPSALSMGEAVTVNLTASKVRSMSKGMFGPLAPNADNRSYDLHGIWQPVKLVVRGAQKLDDVWFKPSTNGADVIVKTKAASAVSEASVKATLTDVKSGRVFVQTTPRKVSSTGATTTLELRDVTPKLWTPDEPNLYRLDVTLVSNTGEILDLWTQNVGFRTFEARGNQFYLNGNPYWLRGADHLPYGKNPFDPALARKLIQALHDANIRITRTHATPWNEAWLNAADEIGLAVSLEGIRPWALAGKIGATPPELFAHWLLENEDVVKRARNHPSVFLYTVGNEMLLRDTKNVEKWKQLSDVVKQTRALDPTRPVICSSEYAREPDVYEKIIQPNGIDDGDADDLHRYNNWYAPSSFVFDAKFEKEMQNNGGTRPLMGQEMSSGYPDLDTGLPVLRYTRDLLTPQAWVGANSYPGSDPAIFLDHHRAVTKRWAERMRFERGTNTAGFMLFATECWFSHSYDANTMKPYPVLEAMREAFAPLGLALETGRRRFFSGEHIDTAVFVTNDDEKQRNYTDLRLEVSFVDRKTGAIANARDVGRLASLSYHETARVPVPIEFPKTDVRRDLVLRIALLKGTEELSHTTDHVEIWPDAISGAMTKIFARNLGPEFTQFLKATAAENETNSVTTAQIILLGKTDDLTGLQPGGEIRKAIENGATAVLFSPSEAFSTLFGSDVGEGKPAPGEYADFSLCAGSPLVAGLSPMDLKWWGRKDDWRVFVADTSHRLRSSSKARELIRYIPPHSYSAAEKIPELYRTVMFEIPLGSGRLWVCDLDLEESVNVDPAARQFAANLLAAAANPKSTATLPAKRTHSALLEGGK